MKSPKNKIIPLLIFSLIFITAGFECKKQIEVEPIELNYWRVWDNSSDFDELIKSYQAIHPHIKINYKKLRFEEYEDELLNALAEDRGPDIFSIHSSWVKKYQNKTLPMPATVTIPYQYTKGTVKPEVVTELRTTKTLSLLNMKNNFVDVVYDDVVMEESDSKTALEKIYALPLYVDTMVLYYNRDLLNNAGVPQPPDSWSELQEAVKRITKIDQNDNIIQAGASVGTSDNIPRSVDLLSLLMMQNGTQMTDESGRYATFHQVPKGQKDRSYNPGIEALNFYTSFTNIASEVYTWNEQMPDALETFIQGKSAMFFGYNYHLPTIKSQATKFNWSTARMPQIIGNPEINYANYWVETVSKRTEYSDEAWDFLIFISKAENVTKYLDKTKRPTALRSLYSQQLEDIELNVFASQVLTAKTWFHGTKPTAMELAFKDMIDSMVQGAAEDKDAINLAAQRVNQTLR